jgi:O-Antigen ligase
MRERTLSGIGIPVKGAVVPPAVCRKEAPVIRHSIKLIVRWAFYAFILSILFEAFPLGLPVELTQVTGAFLVLAAMLQPWACFRRPPAAFWCFAAYVCAGIVSLSLHGAVYDVEARWRVAVFIQLLFFFWVAYNLLRYQRVARGALLALIASCVLLSVLQWTGLAIQTNSARFLGDRFASFGLDPNQMACILSLGLLALVSRTQDSQSKSRLLRILVWPLYLLVAATTVQTGSRGGLLAFAAGLIVLLLKKGTVREKARNALIVTLGIGLTISIALRTDVIRSRFDKTLEAGDMTARERIYPAAWDTFIKEPLIGAGIHTNTYEIQARVGLPNYKTLDAHNLILYVLTSAGLLGAIPFFAGIFLCVRGAWKARGGAYGTLPFAMTVTLLVADMSASGLHWKHHWLVLAFALASGHQETAARLPRVNAWWNPRVDHRVAATAL